METEKNTTKVLLQGDCTIYEVEQLMVELQQALKSSQNVSLDFFGVGEVDASFLQLLLATINEAQDLCIDLSLVNLSDNVKDLASDLYFNEIVGIEDLSLVTGELIDGY